MIYRSRGAIAKAKGEVVLMEDRRELGFEFCCIIDAAVEEVFAAITDKAAISTFEQCSGWTHFFASLKARLEHGVDLKDFYCAHD